MFWNSWKTRRRYNLYHREYSLNLTGNLYNNGGNSPNTSSCGIGGSGSGGSIYLIADNINISGNINAQGGERAYDSGYNYYSPQTSPGGGSGRIRLDYNIISGSTTPSPYSADFYNPDRDRLQISPTPTITVLEQESIFIRKGDLAYGIALDNSSIATFINSHSLKANFLPGWNHITMTYNKSLVSNNLVLYVNGEFTSSLSLTENVNTNDSPLLIGENFAGFLDELRIYNRALPQEELQCHYERRRYMEDVPNYSFGSEESGESAGLMKASALSDYASSHFLGIAMDNCSIGENVAVRISGVANVFSELTIGADYYLSDTVGEISTSSGTYNKRVGIAIAEDRLLISR